MRLSSLRRCLLGSACSLAVLATAGASGPAPDGAPQLAPPEFGVIQFTTDEAFIDLPVPLADAWKTTLEVTASLVPQVRGDLPYLENNGRIVAGDLWVAVEAQGAPGATWTRIRVAVTPDPAGYGQVRAEVLLDAIADRLEPPAPAPERFSYPPPVPVAEDVPVEYVTNNYYYGSGSYYGPYDALPSYAYVPTYTVPVYYPAYYGYPVYDTFGCSPWGWNSGWWYGWGSPWCNPWGSSFSLWYGSGSGWGWGWNGWWDPWDCGPSFTIGWWDWDDWDDWDDGVSGGKGDDIIVIGDDNVIITGSDGDDVVALDPRQTSLRSVPPGDITLPGTAAGRTAGADRTPRVTDRPSRRVSEPLAPVVVTRTERGPRPRTPVAETRPTGERTTDMPEIGRPTIVVTGSEREGDEGRGTAAPQRTSTSPSRSSKKAGPTVVKLGSAPYSARVAAAPPPSRSSGTVATTQGGTPVFTPPAPASSQGRTTGAPTVASHPYSNPYPSAPAPGGGSPGGHASPGASPSAGHSSAPAPRAPSAPAAAPRSSPAPSVPTSLPSRSSAPSVSSRSSGPSAPSGGGGRGPSGGGSSGGRSGGSKGPR